MTANTVSTLNEILQIARDGHDLYLWAADQEASPELRDLFREMAAAKGQLVSELAARVAALGGQPEAVGTTVGGLHKLYAEVDAALSADLDPAVVAQLEESEDRLLHAIEHAVSEDSADTQAAVAPYLPRVRAGHDRMRDLKLALSR